MFGAIKQLKRRVDRIDENKILKKVFDDDIIQGQIVDLNRKQLYEQGIQADGTPTGEYHPITIAYKKQYGEGTEAPSLFKLPGRTDHITGLNTGLTYKSMDVKSEPAGIHITADDRNGFFEREPQGLGLTPESRRELLPEIKEVMDDEIRKKLKL